MERWITIFDKYEISSLGRLKTTSGNLASDKSFTTTGYIKNCININGKRKVIERHKLMAMAFLNHIPCGYKEVVDHIDNNKYNNKLENLQLTTTRTNVNKDRKGSSQYTGVQWYKKYAKWRVAINIENREYSLGYYTDELEAAKVYKDCLNNWLTNKIKPVIYGVNDRRYNPSLKYS